MRRLHSIRALAIRRIRALTPSTPSLNKDEFRPRAHQGSPYAGKRREVDAAPGGRSKRAVNVWSSKTKLSARWRPPQPGFATSASLDPSQGTAHLSAGPFEGSCRGDGMTRTLVKSAQRTMEIFELFSAFESPLSVGEISTHLSIPQSSTSALLKSLNNSGYLEYSKITRRYQPTIRLYLLGAWLTRRFPGLDTLFDEIDRLYRSAGEVITVGIERGSKLQIIMVRGYDPRRDDIFNRRQILRSELENNDHLFIDSGISGSLVDTTIGQLLLSRKSDQEIALIVRKENSETAESGIKTDIRSLIQHLREVKTQGYIELSPNIDLATMAVCIPSPLGSPIGVALSMSKSQYPFKRERALRLLLDFKAEFTSHF